MRTGGRVTGQPVVVLLKFSDLFGSVVVSTMDIKIACPAWNCKHGIRQDPGGFGHRFFRKMPFCSNVHLIRNAGALAFS